MNKDTVTGNTGNAVQDGSARGMLVGLILVVLAAIQHFGSFMSLEDLAYINGAVATGSFFIFGLFDKLRGSGA